MASVVIFPFSHLILLIWVFCLFVNLVKSLVNLVYLFNEPTFCFIDSLCIFLLDCNSLDSLLIFIIFFHLLILGLACYLLEVFLIFFFQILGIEPMLGKLSTTSAMPSALLLSILFLR
jgi:hypothetical protein